MCPGRFSRALAIISCLIGVMTCMVQARDASPDIASFKLKLERLPLRCTPPLYRAYVTSETCKFTFLIPGGFRIKGDSETKIKLSNLEGNCQITFSILDSAPCDAQPLSADNYRDLVQARHCKGKIVEQLTPGAAGRDGVGFDMWWETTNKFIQCTRTAFVPSSVGLLEFTATSGPNDFSSLRSELNQIMGTFQAGAPDSKFEIPVITAEDSDRSDAGSYFRNGQRQTTFWSGSTWYST